MSIKAKQLMIYKIREDLRDTLDQEKLEAVISTLMTDLDAFDVECLDLNNVAIENNEILQVWLGSKQMEGRTEKTLDRYKYIITKMLDFINLPISNITTNNIRKFIIHEKDRGLADSTLEGTREVLSTFFGWLHKEGLIDINPVSNLSTIKYTKYERKPYTPVDIEKLKTGCDNVRDKAIISLMLSTGCRVSEISNMNIRDINFQTNECIVLGKGRKQRTVFIDDVTCMLLETYLEQRKDSYPALFVGKGTDRLKPGGIRYMLKQLSQNVGVENTHPHRFRRTLASSLITRGMPIQEVATILGHDKIDTTMKYIHLQKSTIKSSYIKCS